MQYKKSNNIIRVIRPVLTEEERERRMKIIKEAAAVFLMEAEAALNKGEQQRELKYKNIKG